MMQSQNKLVPIKKLTQDQKLALISYAVLPPYMNKHLS